MTAVRGGYPPSISPSASPTAEYLHSDRDLYHVEHIGPERALLEDCRTGTLLDVPVARLQDLEPVRASDEITVDLSKPLPRRGAA